MLLFLTTYVSFSSDFLPEKSVRCIEDVVFEVTAEINQFFQDHMYWRNIFIITASSCMDIMVLTQFARFAFYGTTWRLPICLLMFYLLRGFCQQVYYVRFPKGFLWGWPGFYSITIPYGKTSDFFFSGHVGMSVICGMEFKYSGWPFMAAFSFTNVLV